MSLADKVRAEQNAVTGGMAACGAPHPAGDIESDCVRIVHLPDDTVHVGTLGTGDEQVFIQWEDS